jgi:hypothetical protein
LKVGNRGFLAVDGKPIGAELDRFLDPSCPQTLGAAPVPTDSRERTSSARL